MKVNVQKIFDTLQENKDNTALGTICAELEEQGYKLRIDSQEVNSADFFDGRHRDLEDKLGPLNVALFKDGVLEQEFSLEFMDPHEVVIERKIE
jgi:hypothetical protein